MSSQNEQFVQRLISSLQKPLPGEAAQWKMAVHPEQHRQPTDNRYDYAGVMSLLYPSENGYELVFIKRKGGIDNDRHSGQISFPGGKYEEGDEDTRTTALRETEEEIGVFRQQIELVGSLSTLYIPVSGFMVHPYVGFTGSKPVFSKDETEVQKILTAPVSKFLDPRALSYKDIEYDGGKRLKNVPYFDLDGEVLWGATAMMLSELLELFRREKQLAKHLRTVAGKKDV